MRLFLTIISLGLFLTSCKSQENTILQLKKDIGEIANDSYEGRATGTAGEKKASLYLISRFKKLKLEPKGEQGYLQAFNFKQKSGPHAQVEYSKSRGEGYTSGNNIIGFYNNQAANTLVIGAHYDHLGYGEQGSLYRGEQPLIHNGADDNASGVACLLSIAANVKYLPKNNNYLFVLFSGEELGLLGSNFFAKNPTIDPSKINYMINMDMVGRLNSEKSLAVYGVGTSPILKSTVEINNPGFKLVFHESGVGPSDHTSFYLINKPVLHFFTGQHEDYHKPSDDSDKINYQGIDLISQFIQSIIRDLDDEGTLAFTPTKNESDTPRFKVSMGVVPDYLYDGKGMRIDGVTEGKPAKIAGLQKGDVVIQLGENPVVDMQSYMKALANFTKGTKTTVKILRNGEAKSFEIEF